MRCNTFISGLLLLASLHLLGCGGGAAVSNAGSGGHFVDMNFGDLSLRTAASNPPVTSSGGGVTVTGLTGQITRMQLFASQAFDVGRIAFTSDRDGNNEVYASNPDGSNLTRLTNNPASDSLPAFSPDGSRIAFTSARDGNSEIYVMSADGSNQTRLTNNVANDYSAKWSPDGSRIAFTSDRDGNSEIYVMNSDGSSQTRITNNAANDYAPTWSPDGSRIAFTSNRDGNDEVYVMSADGSNQRRLTVAAALGRAGANQNFPAWSPDGTRIAYCSDFRAAGASDVIVQKNIESVRFDKSDALSLTYNTGFNTFPSWSPDGKKIAFASNWDQLNNNASKDVELIWLDATSGFSSSGRITISAGNDVQPSWGRANAARTLIGAGGDLGTSSSGCLIGTSGGAAKSAFTYALTDFTAVAIKALSGQNAAGDRLDFDIEGATGTVNFSKTPIAYINFDGSPVVRPFTNYSGNINGLLVSFGAQSSQANAGKVFLVIPFTAPNRSVGRPSVKIEDGVKVYRGTFPAAFDKGGKNIAPNGATEIRVNTKTGAILSVR